MTLQISLATIEDVPKITDFVVQLAEYEKLRHEVNFTESQYEEYLFTATNPPSPEVLLVRDSASDVIGFALFINILPAVIHLEDLFVKPDARGKGAGIHLLSRLAQVALTRGIASLEWACLDWNTPSLNFYKSLGAEPIQDRVLYRITGSALQRKVTNWGAFQIEESAGSPVGLAAVNSDGIALANLSYSLSFTTFLGTPVILVTEIGSEQTDAISVLIEHLIQIACDNKFARIDIRINPSTQHKLVDLLVSEFNAFEMAGWIPFSLSGAPLEQLAHRTSSA